MRGEQILKKCEISSEIHGTSTNGELILGPRECTYVVKCNTMQLGNGSVRDGVFVSGNEGADSGGEKPNINAGAPGPVRTMYAQAVGIDLDEIALREGGKLWNCVSAGIHRRIECAIAYPFPQAAVCCRRAQYTMANGS